MKGDHIFMLALMDHKIHFFLLSNECGIPYKDQLWGSMLTFVSLRAIVLVYSLLIVYNQRYLSSEGCFDLEG